MQLPVAFRRLGYRSAYAGLRLYWFLRRPQVSGVKCVLTDGEQVLLVRHTYGHRNWDLPGGAVKRGEAAEAAARREMREELGVSIEDWDALGEFALTIDHRHDSVRCFHAELTDPELTINRAELAAVGWFPRSALPSELGRYAHRILARVLAEPTPRLRAGAPRPARGETQV